MSEDTNEKIDWVVPVSHGAVLGSTPTVNLQKAAEQKGIRIDNIRKDEKGNVIADIYQDVVTGMPAPRKDASKENKP